MTNLDKETQAKIQELQGFEQNLHATLMQKQAFQLELSETENALEEVKATDDEVFKLIGNILIKTEKSKLEQDLKKKQELLSLRLKSIENQEEVLTKHAEEIRAEVMKKIR